MKKVVYFILSMLWSIAVLGQNSQFSFRHLTVNNGLSSNRVECILQDSKGFIWIATPEGLNRFDGYEFSVFRNIPHDTRSISSNVITIIYEDSRQNIWVGTAGSGLNRFDRNKKNFVRYYHNPDNPNSISSNIVNLITEDSNGNIWVASFVGGCTKISLNEDGKYNFTQYKHNKNNTNGISGNKITSVFEDSHKNIWIATINAGLNLYDTEKDVFVHYKRNSEDGLCDNSITTATEDSKGNLWFGSLETGICKATSKDGKNWNFKHFINDNQSLSIVKGKDVRQIVEDKDGILWISTADGLYAYLPRKDECIEFKHQKNNNNTLINNDIRAVYESTDGNIWIGTWDGLSVKTKENKLNNTFINKKHRINDNSSLNDNKIEYIYEDNFGEIWLGTFAGGVDLYSKYGSEFYHYKHNPDEPKSLAYNSVLSFCTDTKGRLWVGTDGGGLSRKKVNNKKTNSFTHFQHDPGNTASLSSDAILSLFEDCEGVVWIGTWGGGLNKYDEENNKFICYVHNPDDAYSLSSNNIWSIYEDSKQNLWIGTYTTGLNLFDRKKNKFINFRETNDSSSIANNAIWVILEDSYGDLWLGTTGGLSKMLHSESGKISFKNYRHHESDTNSLSNNHVYSIYEDSNQNFWIGTKGGGLNLLDRETGKFTTFSQKNSLPTYVVFGILEDNNDVLWLSTDKGLLSFDINTHKFKNYDGGNSLQTNIFNIGAYHKDKKGNLYFGGVNGFNVFHPDSIKINPHTPPVVITNFQIFNKDVRIREKNSPLSKDITETKKITLSYKQSVFSFEFAILNYYLAKKNKYAYMMEGFDDKWNFVGTERKATYTNLDPGEYVFRVIAANNDGVWNNEGTAIEITITPPWWKTWWFRMLSVLVVAGSALLFYFARMAQMRNQQRILEKKVEERTIELKEANSILEERKEEIESQNMVLQEQQHKLEVKNKEVEITNSVLAERNEEITKAYTLVEKQNKNIKDSINYGRTIQKAILPSKKEIDKHLDNFVVYLPRDIVSGDFYWMTVVVENKKISPVRQSVFIAAVDCTGHGVPGAFMSMIGSRLLSLIVNEWKIYSPAEILTLLNKETRKALKQETTGNDDGMDICLCKIEKELKDNQYQAKVTFSGAKRPLLIYDNQSADFKRIRGCINTIGGDYHLPEYPFENHEINMKQGDTIYLTSDGITDQNNKQNRTFGTKNIKKLVKENADLPIKEQGELLNQTIKEFMGSVKQRDDIVVIGIRF